jgi:hypothetical protein
MGTDKFSWGGHEVYETMTGILVGGAGYNKGGQVLDKSLFARHFSPFSELTRSGISIHTCKYSVDERYDPMS